MESSPEFQGQSHVCAVTYLITSLSVFKDNTRVTDLSEQLLAQQSLLIRIVDSLASLVDYRKYCHLMNVPVR